MGAILGVDAESRKELHRQKTVAVIASNSHNVRLPSRCPQRRDQDSKNRAGDSKETREFKFLFLPELSVKYRFLMRLEKKDGAKAILSVFF